MTTKQVTGTFTFEYNEEGIDELTDERAKDMAMDTLLDNPELIHGEFTVDEGQRSVAEIVVLDPGVDELPHGNKCTSCSYRFFGLYRFAEDPDDVALCGDCFVRFLIEDGIKCIRLEETDDE